MINCKFISSFFSWYTSESGVTVMFITFIVLSFIFGYFKDDINNILKEHDSTMEETPLFAYIFFAFCLSTLWVLLLILFLATMPCLLGNFIRKRKNRFKNNKIKLYNV